MRVADYIVERIRDAGADVVFMLPGGMMMHLMDAVGRCSGIRYVCNFHEQACAMAADAYARESGRLGACFTTSGPGATNILTGLVGAYQDSTPIIFVAGQSKLKETVRGSGISGLRQFGLFEVDLIPIVESVTKYAAFVDTPESVRLHLEKALSLAVSGRPGPVLLEVPLDIQGATINPLSLPGYTPERSTVDDPLDSELEEVIDFLKSGRRPIVLSGYGVTCSRMQEPFRRFIEQLGCPVVTTQLAKDLLPYRHPLFVGHCGHRGDRAANFAVQRADRLLIMGCSLHLQTTGYELPDFAPDASKIQIDLDRAVLARENVGVRRKFCWDLRTYLPRLLATVSRRACDLSRAEHWRTVCRTWKTEFVSSEEPHELGPVDGPINLYEFAYLLSDRLAGDEIVLTDAGQPYYVLAQALQLRESQRYLVPGSLGEMGWALPAAVGAAIASPSKTVVVILGDGSLQTNIQELQTVSHYGLNVKLFIIDNGGYASIRATARAFFGGFQVAATPETGVTLPSLSKIANAYDIPYLRAGSRAEAGGLIQETLACAGPVICGIAAHPDQRVQPGVPSFALPSGAIRSKRLEEAAPDLGPKVQDALALAAEPAGGN